MYFSVVFFTALCFLSLVIFIFDFYCEPKVITRIAEAMTQGKKNITASWGILQKHFIV